MAVERLASEDTFVSYHSYFSAQHAVRYAAVKGIVAGKRVLDVACGEGYGARLFGGEGATFLVSDTETLGKVLDGAAPFDLVVSLETTGHLERPDDFLASLPGAESQCSHYIGMGYGRMPECRYQLTAGSRVSGSMAAECGYQSAGG